MSSSQSFPFIADFDSASGMLRALSRHLRGEDFPGLGFVPTWLEPLGRVLNRLPQRVREEIYIWSGWKEAVAASRLGQVNAEEMSQWTVDQYPQRPYPAVAIGSSSGALLYLCAALGIPWLPQTFLIPVRRGWLHPDEPIEDMRWGAEHARPLLDANPELQLHHMNDANQDRLMIQRMTYFRVKRRRLGQTFERFLEQNLPPGGTILLSECQLTWPTVQVGERHFFQHGALGGATAEEFLHGSPRVEEYLQRYGSHRRRWPSPTPDAERPEAEWGFEEALREDVERIARQRGYRVRRILFNDPEHLSPFVADLYRWWYRQRGLPGQRLLTSCFLVQEPHWTLRTGSVPFWLTFNMEASADALEQYLQTTEPYDEVFTMLFSHGVNSVGLPPLDRWRAIMQRARKRSNFVGVDERAFPRDFATFVRYYKHLQRQIPARYPISGPLTRKQLDNFLEQSGSRYRDQVQWIEQQAPGTGVPASAEQLRA